MSSTIFIVSGETHLTIWECKKSFFAMRLDLFEWTVHVAVREKQLCSFHWRAKALPPNLCAVPVITQMLSMLSAKLDCEFQSLLPCNRIEHLLSVTYRSLERNIRLWSSYGYILSSKSPPPPGMPTLFFLLSHSYKFPFHLMSKL